MSKDPAFLFYPNDWLGGTMGMSFEEKGAYMELLMAQFNRGHMTEHMIGQMVGQLWDNVKDKFEKDEQGLYFNRRLEEEQIKRRNYTESRRNNIKGNNQHTKKPKKKRGHTTSHMENENENENSKLELPFKSENFKNAWNELLADLKERKIKQTDRALKMKLNKLAKYSESVAIGIINQTIENSWQGLYEPKGINKKETSSNYEPDPRLKTQI